VDYKIAKLAANYFYARQQVTVLAIAILSVCPSVCPFITRVDQSKMVQTRIIKSLLSEAWKTLVLESGKLFHKFERSHFKRVR